MKYEWLNDYCMSKKCAERDYKVEWDAVRYMIGGKMFAMRGGDKEAKPIITLKLEPAFGDFLRQRYEDIVPGYYMNKVHWKSLYLEGNVPEDVLKDIVDQSYQLIFNSLSKKVQKEINDRS